MKKTILYWVSLLWVALVASVNAEPAWQSSLKLELNKNSLLNADEHDSSRHKTYLKTELTLQYPVRENLDFVSLWVLEPVQSTERSIAFFQEEGLYLEEAFAVLKLAGARVQLGKFNPQFGVAWDEAPGMYGDDITDEYEVTEQVGAAVSFNLHNSERVQQHLTLAAFTADRSAFSDTLFTRRGRTDNVPGQNVSGSVALDGELQGLLPGISYHLGWRRLAEFNDIAEENDGYAAALRYQTELRDDWALRFLYEWVNVDFVTAGNLVYRTPALVLDKGPFYLGVSRTTKHTDKALLLRDTTINQLSFRYYFKDSTYVGVGLKQSREGSQRYDYFGLRLQSTFDL